MSVSHPGKRIKITIKSATNLPKRHLVLPPNPYVVLTIDEQTHKTAVLKRTGKPVWNATFEITIKESSIITIRILDKRKSAPDPLLGVASIGARRISSFKSERDGHTELTLGLKRQSDSSVTHDVPLASDDQSVMGPSLATDSSITIWTTDLPMGWEKQRAPDGRTYYVDHNTRSTTWYPPHLHSLDSGRQGLMTQKPVSVIVQLTISYEEAFTDFVSTGINK
ncbi:hypothetical protein P691DRAFT_333192 [Macrolepiota fuliginosa MF-IS2]|uniref:HECT-type E3 ubiquitin transferase n=1 Tax=Macrolepiota fuliginosa MF-IS2 TaxID=1400762 RepID=A0A9P5X4Z0_9AGAR|nr:hypothetical protein P691DRAFT_333192 [Macrolepiota fuliginosa MF-IS2]